MPTHKKVKNLVTVFLKPTDLHLIMFTKDTKAQHLIDS